MNLIQHLKNNHLIKNTGIIAIGRISTQVLSFLLLPVYTVYLTTTDYGVVDLLNSLIMLLLPIITLQIEQAVFRFLIDVRGDKEAKKRIISSTAFLIVLQGLVYTVIMFLAASFIQSQYKYFLLFKLLITMFFYVLSQVTRGLGNNKNYALANFISSAILILLNILFIVVFQMGAAGMLLSGMISSVIGCVYISIAIKLHNYLAIRSVDFRKIKEMLLYALPLIPNQLSWWIMNASDRLIISINLSVAMNGIYAVAGKFSLLFTTFFSFFYLSWSEQASIHIQDENAADYFSKTIGSSIKVFSCLLLCLLGIIPLIFQLFINVKYAESYDQIPILIFGGYFFMLTGVYSVIYVAKKNTKRIATTSLLSAVLNLLINIVLIKHIGLYAASISTALAYAALAAYRMIDTRKYIKISIKKRVFVEFLLIFLLTCAGYYMENKMICLVLFVIIVSYSVFQIKNMMKSIKE